MSVDQNTCQYILYVNIITVNLGINRMKITVGLPAYNEEKNIAKIIVELKKNSRPDYCM